MATPAWATQANAQKYYNTLTPEQKQGVPTDNLIEWFVNAVQAGVPDAVAATGTSSGVADQNEGYTGSYLNFQDAADPSEWYGKRKPTPAELRKWAADQHARYVSGDKTAQDEDYLRFDDRTLAGWINEKWDVQKGGFFSPNGERIGKPPDMDSQGVNAYGERAQGGAPGGGGGGGGREGGAPAGAGQSELQRYLTDLYANKGGVFGEANRPAASLEGGGIVWQDADAAANQAPAQGPAPATGPGSRPRPDRGNRGPGPYGGAMGGQDAGSGSAALVSATLNAFTPNAPSATSASPAATSGWQASANTAAGNLAGAIAPTPQPQVSSGGQWNGAALPNPAAGGMNPALRDQLTSRMAWWKQPQPQTR